MRWVAAVALLAWPYIDLAVNVDIAGHTLDTPIADLAGAALVALLALHGLIQRPRAPIAWAAWAGFVAVGVLALLFVPARGASAWYLLRKPIFFYVAYGFALAEVVRGGLRLRPILLGSVALVSLVTIGTSLGRIVAGNALWWESLDGLTNNHKTLAVAVAPTIPLILGIRRSRLDFVVIGLALVSIALSVSRTAWITTAVGLAFWVAWSGRTLAARRGLVIGVIAVGAALAILVPRFTHSNAQMDAARSRHSLDKRAWQMVEDRPVLGWGGGASTRYEMTVWPHYRINGVDAHGAVQKVAAEYGILGLGAWLAFTTAVGLRLWRRARMAIVPQAGLVATHLDLGLWSGFVALHANLLFSTETFSQTHWIPLGLLLGLSARRR